MEAGLGLYIVLWLTLAVITILQDRKVNELKKRISDLEEFTGSLHRSIDLISKQTNILNESDRLLQSQMNTLKGIVDIQQKINQNQFVNKRDFNSNTKEY